MNSPADVKTDAKTANEVASSSKKLPLLREKVRALVTKSGVQTGKCCSRSWGGP